MSALWSVFRKEVRSYVVSPIPYIFLALFTGFLAFFFFIDGQFFVYKRATR